MCLFCFVCVLVCLSAGCLILLFVGLICFACVVCCVAFVFFLVVDYLFVCLVCVWFMLLCFACIRCSCWFVFNILFVCVLVCFLFYVCFCCCLLFCLFVPCFFLFCFMCFSLSPFEMENTRNTMFVVCLLGLPPRSLSFLLLLVPSGLLCVV